jgi:hypothetical protein
LQEAASLSVRKSLQQIRSETCPLTTHAHTHDPSIQSCEPCGSSIAPSISTMIHVPSLPLYTGAPILDAHSQHRYFYRYFLLRLFPFSTCKGMQGLSGAGLVFCDTSNNTAKAFSDLRSDSDGQTVSTVKEMYEGPPLFVNSDEFVNTARLHTHALLACSWYDSHQHWCSVRFEHNAALLSVCALLHQCMRCSHSPSCSRTLMAPGTKSLRRCSLAQSSSSAPTRSRPMARAR